MSIMFAKGLAFSKSSAMGMLLPFSFSAVIFVNTLVNITTETIVTNDISEMRTISLNPQRDSVGADVIL